MAKRNPGASYEQITDGAAIQIEADDIDSMGAEYRCRGIDGVLLSKPTPKIRQVYRFRECAAEGASAANHVRRVVKIGF